MSLTKKFLLGLLCVFVAIQFVRPTRNADNRPLKTDLVTVYGMPDTVAGIMRTACYDCHSNNTRYPWYAQVQPFGWLLANHIKDGKAELNFSEFGNYNNRRQISKLKAVHNSIKEGTMPLDSYVYLHPDAKLTEEQKKSILNWTIKTADSLAATR